MKNILLVSNDADVASRVQMALQGDDFHLEISSTLPIDAPTLDKLDLLIWDDPFAESVPKSLYIEFGMAQGSLPVIGLEPKQVPIQLRGYPIVWFDGWFLRDFDPAELRSFAKRLFAYIDSPDDGIYRI